MKERFTRTELLVSALMNDKLVAQNGPLAAAIAAAGELLEFAPGDTLIEQGSSDNDVYFLLLGQVAVLVHGANVAMRRAGQTVGEMAAVEPSLAQVGNRTRC